MKRLIRLLPLLMAFFLNSLSVQASHNSTTILEFNEKNFNIGTNSNGQVSVSCKSFDYGYESENDSPALPLLALRIPLAPNSTVISCRVKIDEKTIVKQNATVALAPEALPTSDNESSSLRNETFTGSISPTNTLEYVCSSTSPYGDVAHCCICPFEYDSQNKVLYLVSKMTITINYNYIAVEFPSDYDNPSLKESLKNMINVPYDPSVPTYFNKESNTDVINGLEKWDYVIITTEKLKKAFDSLMSFKTALGVRTMIKTVEEIDNEFNEGDIQYKIKKQLQRLYENNKIDYVLLGGDVSEVPTRVCYVKKGKVETTTPADNYYV